MKFKRALFFLSFLLLGVLAIRVFDESFAKTPLTIVVVGLISGLLGLKIQTFLEKKKK